MPDHRISADLRDALSTEALRHTEAMNTEAVRHNVAVAGLLGGATVLDPVVDPPPPPVDPPPVDPPPTTAVRPVFANDKFTWPITPGSVGVKFYDRDLNAHSGVLPNSAASSPGWTPRYRAGKTCPFGFTPVFDPPHLGEDWIKPEVTVTFSGTAPPPLPSPLPPPTTGFTLGMVANSDQSKAIDNSARAGARFIRLEFGNGDSAGSVKAMVDQARGKGMKVLVQCADPWGNLGNVAAWGQLLGASILGIEFGNEDSFSYKGSQGRGAEYGRNYKTVHDGLAGACPLWAQGDDPTGAGWTGAVKTTAGTVDGWVTHPYGPQSRSKNLLDHVMASTTGPVLITEWGLATDDGARLSDNYSWDPAMTYAQAAVALEQSLAWMTATYPRLVGMAYFQAHDQHAPGDGEREHYFGVYRNDSSPKGALTAKYQQLAGVYKGA